MPNSSDGVPLNPLEVTLFNNAYDKDKFENTAWTVNGKLGDIKAVYTGGYLVRHVSQVADYTNYARGVFADYYQCYGPGTGSVPNPNPPGYGDPNLKSRCFSPSSTWKETERNEHPSNEFRLSTPDDWRIRGIVGVFLNPTSSSTKPTGRANPFRTVRPMVCQHTVNTGCMSNVGMVPGTMTENPGVQNDNVAFFEDTHREVKQPRSSARRTSTSSRRCLHHGGARHYVSIIYSSAVLPAVSVASNRQSWPAAASTAVPTSTPRAPVSPSPGPSGGEYYLARHAGRHGLRDVSQGFARAASTGR
jgi:hypothetical protein